MFDDKEPEDIFEGSEGGATNAPGLVQPSMPNQAAQPAPSAFEGGLSDVVTSGPSRTVIIIAVLGVMLVIGIGVALVYVYMSRQSVVPATTLQPTVPAANSTAELPVVPAPVVAEPEPQLPADTDKDGLTDEEEATYRTNPTVVDSDDDGLSDAEEVRTWKTDPLDSDSDNDGFPDGTEVRAGYDPNAVGAKLLTLPGEQPSTTDESAASPAADASIQ